MTLLFDEPKLTLKLGMANEGERQTTSDYSMLALFHLSLFSSRRRRSEREKKISGKGEFKLTSMPTSFVQTFQNCN